MVILVDTSILVYGVGVDHALREPSRYLIDARAGGRIDAATTVEVIQEFVHVRSRRRDRADAVALAREYAALFELLSADRRDLDFGLTLYERYPTLGSFDAVLAAVALNRRVDALVSADREFASIPGLPWVHPLSERFSQLLDTSQS